MKVAVLLHGTEPAERDWDCLGACDALVCADGAGDWLHARGRVPDMLVGDLDSIGAEALAWMEAAGTVVQRHDARKDETDGELALEAALTLRPDRIEIYGATGGRTAMLLANLKLLRRAGAACDAEIVGRGERLRFVASGHGCDLPAGRFSLLAVDGAATVRLEGTAWDGEVLLQQDEARGVSNRARDGAHVQVHTGIVLLVMESEQA